MWSAPKLRPDEISAWKRKNAYQVVLFNLLDIAATIYNIDCYQVEISFNISELYCFSMYYQYSCSLACSVILVSRRRNWSAWFFWDTQNLFQLGVNKNAIHVAWFYRTVNGWCWWVFTWSGLTTGSKVWSVVLSMFLRNEMLPVWFILVW